MNIFFLFFSFIALIIIPTFFKKIQFGSSLSSQFHQQFVEKEKIPMIGGIFILLGALLYLQNFSYFFLLHIILIFLLGFSSDFRILNSPKIRMLVQILVISSFIYFNKLIILDTRIIFLDEILLNKYLNFFFVLFCIMILVNGSNFIDGVNTLLVGYFLIISFHLLNSNLILDLNSTEFVYWIFLLSILFFFNFIKKIFMGDSGAYLLGLIFSYIFIKLHEINSQISPFFIVLLSWYPSYELLFSIIRKFKFGFSPIKADNKHFHQLLYFYFSKKLKINSNYINTITGLVINLFNFIIIYFAFLKSNNTQYQISLIFFCLGVYTYLYLKLFLFRFKL